MSRCSKCNGCTSMWDMYRPSYCHDDNCPEGAENPDKTDYIQVLIDMAKANKKRKLENKE